MAEEIGFKLNVDEGNSQKTVKSFKKELQEAKQEAINMSRQFGELSPQAVKAAAALGALKDEFSDLNQLATNLTDEKKFVAFSSVISGIAGGFSAVQGAIGLATGDSKQFEAVMLKVQSAMAISQGLSQVSDLSRQWGIAKSALSSFTIVQKANSIATTAAAAVQKFFTGAVNTTSTGFKGLKAAIIGTGIGALAIGVGYVVTNFAKLKETLLNLIPGLKQVVEFVGGIIDAVTDFFGSTSEASRAADKLTASIEVQNEAADRSIQLLEASGATSKEVRRLKMDMYNAEIVALLRIAKLNGEASEDEQKRIKELNFQKSLLFVQGAKEVRDLAEKEKKEAEEKHKKDVEEAKKKSDEASKRAQENSKKAVEQKKKDAEDAEKAELEAKQKVIDALKDKHTFELDLLNAQGASVLGVRERQIDAEIELLRSSGGKFAEGITALEREKVIATAQAKTDAEAEQAKIDLENKEKEDEQKAEQDKIIDELRIEGEETELLRIQEKYDAMRAVVVGNEELTTALIAAQAEAQTAVRKKWDDITLEHKRANASQLASILGGLSSAVGKETAVGKGLAIAEATISTYLGAAKALSGIKSGNPFGAALAIAQAAIVVATGLKSVKEIIKTKVPTVSGGGGGGGSDTSGLSGSSSPAVSSAPTMDGIQSTLVEQTNQLTAGKDSLKAYVVESEITQKQERSQAITQTANF